MTGSSFATPFIRHTYSSAHLSTEKCPWFIVKRMLEQFLAFYAKTPVFMLITAIYPTLSVALELEAQSKYRLCNPHFVPRGPPSTGCATCISFPRGNVDSWAFSTNFRTKAHFEASNFHSFLVPSRQISLAFVNGFRQSKSFIFSLIFKECIFGMQIDFYSGVEIQLFLNRFSPSISLSSILAS